MTLPHELATMPVDHVPVPGERAVNPLGVIYQWDSIWGWFNTGVHVDIRPREIEGTE